jgi:hypothetical protein
MGSKRASGEEPSKGVGAAGGGAGGGEEAAGGGGGAKNIRGIARRASRDLLPSIGIDPAEADLYVRVLPTRLAVLRLPLTMLQPSAHALLSRLLFTPATDAHCFWSYTHVDDEISLIVDEPSLQTFPEEALERAQGSSTRWVPLRLCGRSIAFDETGVVSAMFAPSEESMPLLNISTFSTNISLIEESCLEQALASFDVPVVGAPATESP